MFERLVPVDDDALTTSADDALADEASADVASSRVQAPARAYHPPAAKSASAETEAITARAREQDCSTCGRASSRATAPYIPRRVEHERVEHESSDVPQTNSGYYM